MNSDRLKQLQKMLKEEPNDPFLKYAVATEYFSANPEKAYALYSDLLRDHPTYLPTYYQAAHLAEELGDDVEAKAIYEKGIEIAKEQNNFKTRAELQSALDELLFE